MKQILTFALFLILSACDPAVTYDKIIQNESSYAIWLIKSDTTSSSDYIKDSVLLSSKESFVIDGDLNIGGSLSAYESCPLYPFPNDTLFTRIDENSNLKLKIIIDGNSAWKYKVLEPGQSGSAECRLVITDKDIE